MHHFWFHNNMLSARKKSLLSDGGRNAAEFVSNLNSKNMTLANIFIFFIFFKNDVFP